MDSLTPTEATRRWAALLQQVFEVDPLACPTCHATMRVVAFITQASVIDQILTHLRTRATVAAQAGCAESPIDPSAREPGRAGARTTAVAPDQTAPRPVGTPIARRLRQPPSPRARALTGVVLSSRASAGPSQTGQDSSVAALPQLDQQPT